MESIDLKKINNMWNKDGKNLKKPSVLLAKYKEKQYFVFRDDSSVIFMIAVNCNVTIAIPKKYCKLRRDKYENNFYEITQIENSSVVSCTGSPNNYETFVIENLVGKLTCK